MSVKNRRIREMQFASIKPDMFNMVKNHYVIRRSDVAPMATRFCRRIDEGESIVLVRVRRRDDKASSIRRQNRVNRATLCVVIIFQCPLIVKKRLFLMVKQKKFHNHFADSQKSSTFALAKREQQRFSECNKRP